MAGGGTGSIWNLRRITAGFVTSISDSEQAKSTRPAAARRRAIRRARARGAVALQAGEARARLR